MRLDGLEKRFPHHPHSYFDPALALPPLLVMTMLPLPTPAAWLEKGEWPIMGSEPIVDCDCECDSAMLDDGGERVACSWYRRARPCSVSISIEDTLCGRLATLLTLNDEFDRPGRPEYGELAFEAE